MSEHHLSRHLPTRIERVTNYLRHLDHITVERVWQGVTALIALFLFGYGMAYALAGNAAAGPSWDVLRQLGGVVPHAVGTAVVGVLLAAAIRTPLAQLTLFAVFCWCLLEAIGFGAGWITTGQGPGAVILWAVLVGPLVTFMMFIAPDKRLLLALIARVEGPSKRPPATPPGRRGGVA